jgi:rhodanese-related sulfurtransferase
VGDRRTVNDLLEASRARLSRLEAPRALEAQARGALIIDTRCAEQRAATGIIPGSVHVPLSVLYWRLDPASGHDDPALSRRGGDIILVCAHGYSSSIAAATLHDLGLRGATDIVGGFEAWSAAGLPIVPLPGPGAVDDRHPAARIDPPGLEVG